MWAIMTPYNRHKLYRIFVYRDIIVLLNIYDDWRITFFIPVFTKSFVMLKYKSIYLLYQLQPQYLSSSTSVHSSIQLQVTTHRTKNWQKASTSDNSNKRYNAYARDNLYPSENAIHILVTTHCIYKWQRTHINVAKHIHKWQCIYTSDNAYTQVSYHIHKGHIIYTSGISYTQVTINIHEPIHYICKWQYACDNAYSRENGINIHQETKHCIYMWRSI